MFGHCCVSQREWQNGPLTTSLDSLPSLCCHTKHTNPPAHHGSSALSQMLSSPTSFPRTSPSNCPEKSFLMASLPFQASLLSPSPREAPTRAPSRPRVASNVGGRTTVASWALGTRLISTAPCLCQVHSGSSFDIYASTHAYNVYIHPCHMHTHKGKTSLSVQYLTSPYA